MNSTADASNPLDAPGDIGVPLIILTWVLFGVAFLIVALRIWTRLVYLGSRLALHDWLILCAVVSEIIHSTLLTMAQKYGLGRHIGTLQGPNISKAAHYMHVSESFSIITSYFGRISFAVFLLSVMGKTAKTRRHILFALIIIDTIINVIVAIQTYSQCGSHINALWHPALQKLGYCESPDVETYIGYVQASINSLCDLVLTIIPITIVYKLKMPRSTKLGLGALLTLSSFALIASIAKAIEIQQLAKGPDFTCKYTHLLSSRDYPLTFDSQITSPCCNTASSSRTTLSSSRVRSPCSAPCGSRTAPTCLRPPTPAPRATAVAPTRTLRRGRAQISSPRRSRAGTKGADCPRRTMRSTCWERCRWAGSRGPWRRMLSWLITDMEALWIVLRRLHSSRRCGWMWKEKVLGGGLRFHVYTPGSVTRLGVRCLYIFDSAGRRSIPVRVHGLLSLQSLFHFCHDVPGCCAVDESLRFRADRSFPAVKLFPIESPSYCSLKWPCIRPWYGVFKAKSGNGLAKLH